MKLFKKITYPKKVKSLIFIFTISFFMNDLIAFGSENKTVFLKSNDSDTKFEETFFQNSIPYDEYDNSESQLEMFFGKLRDPKQSSNTFYEDAFIVNISDSLREIYKSKLNDMAIHEIKYNDNK